MALVSDLLIRLTAGGPGMVCGLGAFGAESFGAERACADGSGFCDLLNRLLALCGPPSGRPDAPYAPFAFGRDPSAGEGARPTSHRVFACCARSEGARVLRLPGRRSPGQR